MSDFFDAIRRFLLDYLPKQRCLSKNTILSYRQTLNIFVAYMRDEIGIGAAELTFSRVDRDVILNFLTWLEKARGCSVSTRNQRLMALRSFLDFAGQIDCTQTSLYLSACNIPSKEAHGRIVEFLTEPALTALLQQPNPSRQKDQRNLVFMILMYDTAARCSELLDMKACDLRLDAKHPIAYLHGKGRKTRTVPLLNRTVQHCKQYLNKFHPNKDDYSEAPLFYTVIHGRQQKMSPDTVAAFFAKYGSMAKAVCQEVPEHIHPHMMPSILCINDQGGQIMECSENITGTLRAQEHGHQPLVLRPGKPLLYENYGIDSRYTGPHKIAPTLSARMGTGGLNTSIVQQVPEEVICIAGNAIDRQPQNGGNGFGWQRDISYTLTTSDRHSVYARQRVDQFRDDEIASTESARQHKDATDLICQPPSTWDADCRNLIRRLTPLECERLQGYPDGWTDVPGASDSARYKALGNSVYWDKAIMLMMGTKMA